jgi:hypothetical protein
LALPLAMKFLAMGLYKAMGRSFCSKGNGQFQGLVWTNENALQIKQPFEKYF